MPNDEAKFLANYWRGLYATPRAWAHRGEKLYHAFEVLADACESNPNIQVKDEALMLAGMASEVLLKTILVNDPLVRSAITTSFAKLDAAGKARHKAFFNHKLPVLAGEAGVPLSKEQVLTAEVLSEFIYWRGRYVIPREPQHLEEDMVPSRATTGLRVRKHLSITLSDARTLVLHLASEVKRRLNIA